MDHEAVEPVDLGAAGPLGEHRVGHPIGVAVEVEMVPVGAPEPHVVHVPALLVLLERPVQLVGDPEAEALEHRQETGQLEVGGA